MASDRASIASGAAQDGHDLRRRNVPSQDTNGGVVPSQKEVDDKKAQKVRRTSGLLIELC